jgi:hypothetical protein
MGDESTGIWTTLMTPSLRRLAFFALSLRTVAPGSAGERAAPVTPKKRAGEKR